MSELVQKSRYKLNIASAPESLMAVKRGSLFSDDKIVSTKIKLTYKKTKALIYIKDITYKNKSIGT